MLNPLTLQERWVLKMKVRHLKFSVVELLTESRQNVIFHPKFNQHVKRSEKRFSQKIHEKIPTITYHQRALRQILGTEFISSLAFYQDNKISMNVSLFYVRW